MKINKRNARFGMLLLVVVLVVISVSSISGYTRAENPNIKLTSEFIDPGEFDKSSCEAGIDFLVQIAPFGCTPSVIRSDLLEENDVNVFCQMGATQINPLVDVKGIDGISFSGDFPPEVTNVRFYPARAALGVEGELSSPVLNNIGYAVITLKQNPNESSMPDFVEGNLTARLRYDAEEAFGVGRASFYLPQLTEEEFRDRFRAYSFWGGKGYLRVEDVEENNAVVSVYDRNLRRISNVNLRKGETSNPVTIPGFDFCSGDMKIKLNDLEDPDTRARLRINSQSIEVVEGERFLDNKCRVQDIMKEGLVQNVKIRCDEDDDRNTFTLKIEPRVTLSIDGIESEFERGDIIDGWENGELKLFLGYVGEDPSGTAFVVPVISPARTKEEFLNSFVARQLPIYIKAVFFTSGKGGLVEILGGTLTAYASLTNILTTFIGTGAFPAGLYGEDGVKISAVDTSGAISGVINLVENSPLPDIEFTGFAGGEDVDLVRNTDEGREFLNKYNSADSGYKTVVQNYFDERYPNLKDEEPTLDEQASYELILFSRDFNQKRTMIEFCEEFKVNYPDSERDLSVCEEDFRFSSKEIATRFVSIGGKTREIAFDGIAEPSFDEYGAEIVVSGLNGVIKVQKNQIIHLSETEFIVVDDINEDHVIFNVLNVDQGALREGTAKVTRLRVDINDFKIIGKNNYNLRLTNINLKKYARVSIIPDVSKTGAEADFGFKIGIEKRNFKLSPEKTQEKIDELNETITTLNVISGGLETATRGLQTACLATGATLTIKNLFENLGGKGIARQKVMRGSGGWVERCVDFVEAGKYETQEQCFIREADNIDSDVEKVSAALEKQNEDIKIIQGRHTESKFLGDDIVATGEFMKEYAPNVQGSLSVLGDTLNDPQSKGEPISVNEINQLLSKESWENNNFELTELRDIDLHLRILDSDANEGLKNSSRKELYSLFKDVKVNSNNFVERSTLQSDVNEAGFDIQISSYGGEKSIGGVYQGGTALGSQFSNDWDGREDDTVYPVEIIIYQSKKYVAILQAAQGPDYFVDKMFEYNGASNGKIQIGEERPDIAGIFSFKKFDSETYKNPFKPNTAEVKYFETAPYKGLPAIVPFDLDNGWYAGTRQTLPTGGNIRTFDASGRVNSFMLCNVGKNGLEEFNSGLGDDICTGMNLGTGQPYDQVHGLTESEARKRVNEARDAIQEAAGQHSSGVREVIINGRRIKVGSPALDIPDIQCQDFMSPKECNLIFNLCDPVFCPSSRCDLGGQYPVRDVVQSGVVGSLFLCLPNIKEGIAVPICLTGVKAGVDNWKSLAGSYQECLQTSLDTGQTVGICDEINSIYMCELFWREVLPIANVAIPKITEALVGQNVRGGGEYLNVQDAFARSQSSINFFTQSYADDSSRLFKIRSTAEAGTAICKNFASVVYPDSADLLDTISEPASPPQFSGRFDEIPFTDVTVPPISQYKVFYHIYAGENTGAYYSVFLKADPSSFYRDVSTTRIVASGFIPVGESVSETPDFPAPSGYRELCINVNGQEECGFKEVSTSFAVDYIKDQYLGSQASETQITSEAECVSGTIFDIDPNIVSPNIYNRNIIRICATDDPGVGSDPLAKTDRSRWRDVGHCGNENLRCFLDSESVGESIKSIKVEEDVLERTTDNYLDSLTKSEGFLSLQDTDRSIDEIEDNENPEDRINKIDNIVGKTFFVNAKGYLELLRANAYRELALNLYTEILKKENQEPIATETQTQGEETQGEVQEQETQKSYRIDEICFEFGGEKICENHEILETQTVEIVVSSENNCEDVNYDIFLRKTGVLGFVGRIFGGDELILNDLSLEIVNANMERLDANKRPYYVRGHCFDDGGRDRSARSSFLTIRDVPGYVRGEGIPDPFERYNEEDLKNLFEKYAEENLPSDLLIDGNRVDWNVDDFRALLVAIAHRQSNLGYPQGGYDPKWIMEYGWVQGQRQPQHAGAEVQIREASKVLGSGLSREFEGIDERYGNECKNKSNKNNFVKCIVSVYLSGIKPKSGFLFVPQDEANIYAEEVIELWEFWKGYFRSQ